MLDDKFYTVNSVMSHSALRRLIVLGPQRLRTLNTLHKLPRHRSGQGR